MQNKIKMFYKIFILMIIGALPLLSGCSSNNVLADYIAVYCNKPVSERIILRQSIATATAPNVVKVDCARDNTLVENNL